VLLYLLQNRDRLVSKDDLIASVWGGRIVSYSNLTSRINAVRRAIGDSGEDQKLIRTIPRKGFRFVGVVTPEPEGDRPQPAATKPAQGSRELLHPASVKPGRPRMAK
jgi:DNA-binding winged helix-turn-helix (wHTH) protein